MMLVIIKEVKKMPCMKKKYKKMYMGDYEDDSEYKGCMKMKKEKNKKIMFERVM